MSPETHAKLLSIGQRLLTQDNRCTANPLFIVQQQREYGCEPGEGDHDVWLDSDWQEVDEKTAKKLDSIYAMYSFDRTAKQENFLESYTQRGVRIIWEFCMASFTEEGCKEYLELNGHNLNNPRIYAESFNRCPEMLFIRDFLISLTTDPSTPVNEVHNVNKVTSPTEH